MAIESKEYCTVCKKNVKFIWHSNYKECNECGKKQEKLTYYINKEK